MKNTLKTIDDLLRGRMTRKEDLAAGKIQIPIGTLIVAGLAMGAIYGLFMGLYAPLRSGNPSYLQLIATAFKVPLLFILTLVVTYPSLYVVSALFDSKLRHAETLRLLLAAMAANLALLASFGPVTGFFTLCTESYAFMIVLNVALFGAAGFVGLGFLRRALTSVFVVEQQPPPVPLDAEGQPLPRYRPPKPPKPPGLRVFSFWILIYGVVGAQMGWVLRPFIGTPDMPFELFRSGRDSNFFEGFFRAIANLFA